jgi:ribosomal protein S18 acetylase RimI-like enzyme
VTITCVARAPGQDGAVPTSDPALYARGAATLLASWEQYARGSSGATLLRLRGVAVAVFPEQPERAFYNNALLDRGLDHAERASALDAMEHAYATADVERYAAWVDETDVAMRAELEARGYLIDERTRAMGICLDEFVPLPADIDIDRADWQEYLRILGLPVGLLGGVDPSAFHVLVARLGGQNVAAAMAYEHDGDCGIFNVTTLESARRRGIGTALTARLVQDAAARGCSTATLQSTPMAERVYARVGFRDLGRILEYVPR